MQHEITDKANLRRTSTATFQQKIASPFISLTLDITCLNIAEVLLPRYKLRKICHRKLVSNLRDPRNADEQRDFLHHRARCARSSFPFILDFPILWPVFSLSALRRNIHEDIQHIRQCFGLYCELCWQHEVNYRNYHYHSYVKEGEYKARRINDNHKRNAIG